MLQTKSICILWDTGGKASYTFPSCVHVDFPASDANPVHFPLVEFCVPCVPSDTGGTPPQPAVPQNHARPRFAPRRPVLAGFHPRWGNDPSQPGQGAVWATQGSVWQKEKKTAQPGKQPPAQTKNTPALGFPSGTRVPQKPAVVRGVKKEQVKGPGSLEASRAGSLRPAEPVVEGFFTGVNFPVFRGRFWALGVTDGVRKAKFPGGKPFSRVSPPGSTKG